MSILQEVTVSAAPARVFETLTKGAPFSAMSGGAPAEIDAADGGAFAVFGGMIHGRIIESVPGTRVVQAWRVKAWPSGLYSVVRFELAPSGSGTKITLEHTGYPEEQKEHLTKGWHANYLEPLAKLS